MKIEEEIKQPKFRSEFHKLVINVSFTSNWLTRIGMQILKPYKLTTQQFNVLRILRGQYPKPSSINLITDRMIDKMSNASRLVDKLVAKGLVDRTVCPNDRRQVDVLITEKGSKLLTELDEKIGTWETHIEGLNEKEAKQLNILLDKMRG
ncbi:MAG TPA: MarR family transcriptional regulator [Candidatus Kapabacteria bacterium]|nr:MarR family transcriptional regulator [Candidatus Kapabacteria bacterium]